MKKIIEEKGFISYNIFNRSFSTGGGNFMAKLYEIDIKGKTNDDDKEINVFIKYQIEDSQLSIVDVKECYYVENFFYRHFCKVFDEIQNHANIPVEERLAMVKSYDTKNPKAIILENLAKKGFTTIHRTEVPSLKFAQLAIKQLARFHGLSWVLEKYQPEYFTKTIKSLKPRFIFGEDYRNFIKNITTYTDKCIREEKKAKWENFKARMMQKLKEYSFDNSGSRCCLIHGDFWISNILVKKDGDDISEVIPVDYQLMYYGCPVMDFIFFIFMCFDQDSRNKYLDDLKNMYHDVLAKFLKYFDIDVESVYPRHEFEAEYKKRRDFGLIMSVLLLPVLFTADDEVPDINKEDLANVVVTPGPKMDERIKGLVDDFERWGVL